MRTIGLRRDEARAYESESVSFFRREFFDRFDEVVTFEALDTDAIRDIAGIELGEVSRREGLVKRGLRLEWFDRLVHSAVERGFDARYTARFRQRTINREVGRSAVALAGGPCPTAGCDRRLDLRDVTAVCDDASVAGSRVDVVQLLAESLWGKEGRWAAFR